MNTLLILFALPVATIILAVVLEKILRCPFLTALTFFAIYLIVTFAAFDATFLINTIIYTILALISALIAEFFFERGTRNCNCNNRNNSEDELSNAQLQNIASRVLNMLSNNSEGNNNCSNNSAIVNVRNNNGNQTTWCCRRR